MQSTAILPVFDLAVNAVIPVTGVHDEWGNVYVTNNYCNTLVTDAVVTVHYSRKYDVVEGSGGLDVNPTPTSYTDSSITWDVSSLSSISAGPVDLYYAIWTDLAGPLLTPGDTVSTYVTVTPIIGDVDTINNNCVIHDTVRAGCDPNEMWVSPTGHIASGAQLEYTAEFENTGNDTAFNISILDTLSDYLDPNSLRVISASATMNIGIYTSGVYTITKFDFPGINLLDSSHHGQCTGMVIFTINSKAGLPDCTAIFNHAGIFFDINPVVMTDTVESIIGDCSTTSVNNIPKTTTSICIFPNPATNELSIIMSPGAYSSFTITNNIGQQMIQQPLNQPQTQVNVATLPPGLYYITFKGDNGTTVQKFVKL